MMLRNYSMMLYENQENKTEYAERIIAFLKYKAVNLFTPFAPIVEILEPFCVDEYEPEPDTLFIGYEKYGFGKNKKICTDGVHLFYYTDELINAYKKAPKELFSGFLHILIHIMELDIDRRKGAVDRCIFDRAVNGKNGKTAERFFPEYLCRSITDTHVWWDSVHPLVLKKAIEEGNGEKKGKLEKKIFAAIRKKYQDAAAASEALMADPGIMPGTEPLGVGYEAEVKRYDSRKYEEILMETLSDGAGKVRDSDEIFDYNWYERGMSEYDSHPFIEAYEDAERPDFALKDIVIAIDTSGSCVDYGSGFISETVNTLMKYRLLGKGVCVMECDADVNKVTFIRNHSDLDGYTDSYELSGGGGTDFRPVFEKIEELRKEGHLSKKINGLLYFSDTYGTFPEEKPDYPVWFAVPENHSDAQCPDYVGKIIIDNEQMKKWEET